MRSIKQDAAKLPKIDQAARSWIAVVRTYNLCTAVIARRIAPLGISVLQHEILINLLREPGLTQQQLSNRCFTAKSGVSKLVSAFEADGVVQRKIDPTDQRARSLSLTPMGEQLAKQLSAIQAEIVSAMADVFDPRELERLEISMDKTAAVLRALNEK